jgi:hypothetical protein
VETRTTIQDSPSVPSTENFLYAQTYVPNGHSEGSKRLIGTNVAGVFDVTASLAIVSASSDVVQEGETLFALATKSEADDALSYAWVSHGITVGTGASYTVQESDEGDQITLTVTDTTEDGVGVSTAGATSGTVVDAPLAVAVPLGVVSVNENTPITIRGITVTGDTDDTPSVTLSVLHGTLSSPPAPQS